LNSTDPLSIQYPKNPRRQALHADLLIQNAKIRTLDHNGTVAQSLAALNGRIVAVGTDLDLTPLAGPKTVCIDLGGRTVLPGFIDAHEHLSWFAEEPLKLNLSPEKVSSLTELLQKVENEVRRLAAGQWVRGVLYDDTKMAEGRRLTRDDLDTISPNNPVIVIHVSGHWAVVNSAGLKLGGFDRHSSDPEGGTLGRESVSGRLDGRLIEMAMFEFAFESMTVKPTVVPPFPRDVRKTALLKAAGILTAAGVCGVGDALCAPSYVTSYHELAAERLLPLRVNMIIPYYFLSNFERLGLIGKWGNAWVRSSGIKVIVDGAIAGRTAALKEGYANDPSDHGVLLIEDQAELNAIVRRIHDLGYQACIHANGDVAIDMALNAIEQAQTANPRPDPRHRIEHCTMINDDFLDRMVRLNILALPFGSYIWQHGEKLERFYGKRAVRMFAHKSFLDAGVHVAGSSDHPAGLYPPLLGVQSMVTRQTRSGEVIGPQERIPLEEAFKMYTVYAAYATFEEQLKGELTPRRLADMVVLGQDPWEVEPLEIGQIPVDLTIVDGKVVHGQI
jgi:predicted amidohydrolase YtcJ